jgi:hypothetical protein
MHGSIFTLVWPKMIIFLKSPIVFNKIEKNQCKEYDSCNYNTRFETEKNPARAMTKEFDNEIRSFCNSQTRLQLPKLIDFDILAFCFDHFE